MKVKTKAGRKKRKEAVMGYLFAAPWLIGFVVLMAFPLFYSLYLSFTNATTTSISTQWRGISYYKTILADPVFWGSVSNTLKFVLLSVPLNLLFSLYLALLLNAKVPGRKLFRALYYIPTLVTIVAVVYLWRQLLGSSGVINQVLSWFGVSGPDWFHDYTWATPGLAIMGMWSVGGVVVIFLSALTDVPAELYEAAKLDGSSEWQVFKDICLPQCRSALYSIAILVFIDYWNMVEQPIILLPDAEKQPLSVYLSTINSSEVGLAFAIATIYMVPSLLLFLHGEDYLVEGIAHQGSVKG